MAPGSHAGADAARGGRVARRHRSAQHRRATRELAKIGPDRPVIVSTHFSLAAIRNPDALIDAIGDANVILILGGHLHRTHMAEYRGRRVVQLPSPKACSEIIVIRIDMNRLLAIPYDYRRGEWLETLIDAPITRGSASTAQD